MTIYYVSKSGKDSNPGTQNQPWSTIRHAVNSIVGGDTVLIQRGTYNETVSISKSGLSNSARTIFSSYSGDERLVIIDGTGLSPLDGIVGIYANYVTFQNISVEHNSNPYDNDNGIYVDIANHDVTIYNCYTYDTAGLGIKGMSSNILIDTCEVVLAANGNWTECLDVTGSKDWANDHTTLVNGFEIRYCYVHDSGNGLNKDPSDIINGGEGILTHNAVNGKIHHNKVVNTKRVGIYVENDLSTNTNQNVQVYNNLVHDIRYGDHMGVATEQTGYYTNGIQFYNNIVYNSTRDATLTVDGPGNINNIQVINNTIDGSLAMWGAGATVSGITFRNNVCNFINTDTPRALTMDHNWKLNTQGSSGLFLDYTGFNYHLISTSPLIGAGSSIGSPSLDFDGNTRPSPPSIGAYEYVAVGSLDNVQLSLSIAVGTTKQITVKCFDKNNNSISCPPLNWLSDNILVATVGPTGVVKGVGKGTANITASALGIISNKFIITVT